jgi:putative alpha-1,2-mannosidase
VHMHNDLRRTYGEDFLLHGFAQPITHTLDIAFGYWCTAKIAAKVGDRGLAAELERMASRWINAFDPDSGLLKESTFYEGSKHNYSFRLLHDMAERIALSGGDEAFVDQLDRFFGYGADEVVQPGLLPGLDEMIAGYSLGRFEGLNNEPDMDAPWAYHYAGRPDRTAEVVHAVVHQQFGVGRGGLPGNDDSGGLSSWYVWATLGLFPVAGQNVFLVSTPAVRESEIETGDATFRVRTEGFRQPEASGPAQYVQSIALDGRTLERTWLRGQELHRGGDLVITLGDDPAAWRRAVRPPSTPER